MTMTLRSGVQLPLAGPAEDGLWRFLSLGGGWQSSCLALMSAIGELPKLDAAIFADTQNEMPETYEYLDYLETQLRPAGIPLIRATAGNLFQDVEDKAGKGMQPSLPVRVRDENGKLQRINSYTCSYDYKRRIVTREVRKLCGPRGAWKHANVEQWIGYTIDEMSRLKQDLECRCGHAKAPSISKRSGRLRGHERSGQCRDGRRQEGDTSGRDAHHCDCQQWDPWRTNYWPLVMDKQMRRHDCERWIVAHGHPDPPPSACWGCPNRGNGHWRNLRDNKPDLWNKACALDVFIRHGLNGLKGEAFLHQSGVPLAEADLRSSVQRRDEDDGEEPLFVEVDMDCDAGVCFT